MNETPNWQYRLWRILDNKKNSITFMDYNRVNYRVEETLGRESEYMGFSACALYYKLSSMMDLDKISEVLKIIAREIMHKSYGKFMPLFIQKDSNDLLKPEYRTYDRNRCLQTIKEFHQKYAINTDSFSAVIDNIRKPGDSDINVILSDRSDTVLADSVKSRLGFTKKNWIYIQVDKELPVEVVDMKKQL